jgi:hypothetical protein
MTNWHVHTVINYDDGTSNEMAIQGPWTIEQANAFVRSLLEAWDGVTSYEFILVPAT